MYLRGFLNVAEGRKRRSQWRSEAAGGGHHQPPRALTSERRPPAKESKQPRGARKTKKATKQILPQSL